MDDLHFAWPFLIPIVSIIGAFTYAIVATMARARVRELEVRERIAMIERGLVPAPEVDPRGFDRAMSRMERREIRYGHRHRSAGVTLMGVGFGLMVLIAFTADSSIAIGVGGFLVVIALPSSSTAASNNCETAIRRLDRIQARIHRRTAVDLHHSSRLPCSRLGPPRLTQRSFSELIQAPDLYRYTPATPINTSNGCPGRVPLCIDCDRSQYRR